MEELLKHLAQSLVENPDQVTVTRVENERNIVLELRVAESDMGRVIGKQGRIAKAIRTVIKAATMREDKRVLVEIL
ncbi:MAG: KH domain-containing protein [Clostridia bacterium]|nr:KH domain-containing protein [Clostridia bacterium]